MQLNNTQLFIEINNLEFVIAVGECNESEDFKLSFESSIPLNEIKNEKITDYDLVLGVLKERIFSIEQKFNCVFKDVILIINNLDCSLINFCGFKRLNGSQLTKQNITYLINALKSKIVEVENQKSILHIFNSKYFLDKKQTSNLPVGLFGEFYSHELSFFLINNNDYKNIKNILKNCNLSIKKIISKSFVEGSNLINNNLDLETFFKIEINNKDCNIFLFENSALQFIQNFKFGSDIIKSDISKISGLDKFTVDSILQNFKFVKEGLEEEILEKEFFKNKNFRKIKKNLILDVANSRIEELLEIIIFKNINLKSFKDKNIPVFLNIFDNSVKKVFENNFKILFNKNNFKYLKFVNEISNEQLFENANKLVQYGWKKEALPITQEKKSIITRLFDLFFK